MRPTNYGVQLPTISIDDQGKIDTLAAHFVEGSDELIGLSAAITSSVRTYIAKDNERRRRAALHFEAVRKGKV